MKRTPFQGLSRENIQQILPMDIYSSLIDKGDDGSTNNEEESVRQLRNQSEAT